jgi:putative tryptophan/tyrosine transport system substrate-binding protein
VVPLKIYMPSIQAAASSLAVEVNAAPVHAQDEIEGVIAAQARERGNSIIVMPDPFNVTNSQQIVLLANRYGVPAMYFTPTHFAESGGLVAYGSDFTEQFPQAAAYVDRILKGAKPSELPVQAPIKFDLVINLKTAKALGLDVPPSLLARAGGVVEWEVYGCLWPIATYCNAVRLWSLSGSKRTSPRRPSSITWSRNDP